jgi:hypothetical protein
MTKISFGFVLALIHMGCASATKQTDAFLRSPTNLPSRAQVENVPFINQSAGHCGPATLAMTMAWAGRPVSVDAIAAQVYTPGMKGSLQTDLISAGRRNGLMTVPISGLESLLREVAAGQPVIVFENLSVSWFPQWHYAVVLGYDIPKQEVIMHSGPEALKRWDLRKFERSWMLGDYWGLVVLPPDQIAVSAGELANANAASGLEQTGKLAEAHKAYRRILQEWPDSLPALIGLANVAFTKGSFAQSAESLRRASKRHSGSAVVWHNLAIAEGKAQQKTAARRSALRAIELATGDQKSAYQENLAEWLQDSVPMKNHPRN